VLLGIPVAVAVFLLVIFIIFLVIIVLEYRRNRLRFSAREQFEDEFVADAEEVAETYMRLLESVTYNKNEFKYSDCSICLREFDEAERLQRIPNCEHVFHEECLRKWFL
jgi:hypothetical protein